MLVNIVTVELPCNISQLNVFIHFMLDFCDSSVIFYFEGFLLLILKTFFPRERYADFTLVRCAYYCVSAFK